MDVCQSNTPEQQLPEQLLARPESLQQRFRAGRLLHFVVMMAGIGLALVVSITGGPIALWGKISGPSATQSNSALASAAFSDRNLDLERPQKQAVILLERAVSRSDEMDQTEAQIEARVDAWRGKLKWDSQLGDLTTVALNSRDQRLRSSAVEVQLAAYGLPKNESSVDALIRQAESRDHAKKIWALWMLGLLGNRGVETDRVVQILTAQLKDSGKDSETGGNKDQDEDARRWAVQGLALVGTTPTIAPLLDAMHNDPSKTVRERAASSLAESAMLSQDQRLVAVPQLINYSGDPALDAQTHALAFQALAAITKQHLPNDSAIWRNWYQTSEVSSQ
jgi:HEAT repeat protein